MSQPIASSATLLLLLLAAALPAAERVNHAGRRLPTLPPVKAPIAFNTAQADAVLAAMQIMPVDSPWNEEVASRPLHPDSAAIIARIRADLPGRTTVRVFPEMNFAIVPDAQPLVPLRVTETVDESDFNGGKAPVAAWPIPPILPVEGWPSGRPAGETLLAWQRDAGNAGGDRHIIVVQPGRMRLFEGWQGRLAGDGWQASCSAIFALDSNALRPERWTSADAAGLPMFPALVRFDECERGVIEHALRVIVKKTRREYLYPATHYASPIKAGDPAFASYPAMGQRLRLKASFAIPARWSRQSRAVAVALQTYGALVADNGGFFSISATPDDRFPSGCFNDVQGIDIDQFEVVVGSGPDEGPRAPGASRPKARRR